LFVSRNTWNVPGENVSIAIVLVTVIIDDSSCGSGVNEMPSRSKLKPRTENKFIK